MVDDTGKQPETAPPRTPASGFPETPGKDPGDRSKDPSPHHALNAPADDPDPTEWPDPYDKRPDPRDPAVEHPATGSVSTSQPHPSDDPQAVEWEGPKRDKLDD